MAQVEGNKRRWITPAQWHKENPDFGTKNFIYACAASGKLPSIKIGGRVLIAADALDSIYEEQANNQRVSEGET